MQSLHQALQLHQAGNPAAAIPLYQQALTENPTLDVAHYNLALAYLQLARPHDAIPHFERAASLAPTYSLAHANLGYAYLLTDQLDNAITSLERAITIAPQISKLHLHLGHSLKARAQLTEALTSYRRAIHLDPTDPAPQSSLLYLLHYHPDSTPESIYKEHVAWASQFPPAASPSFVPSCLRGSNSSPRLRIAYLGSNFNDHCQSLFTYPLLSHHNHNDFEIFIYSSTTRPDHITEKLRPHADTWCDVPHLTNDQLAQQIRTDQIDLLIDLTMHMADNRLQVFAHKPKPAPLQLTWLAYPSTTGLSQIDYRLTDPHLDPLPLKPAVSDGAGQCACLHSEQSLHLPHTFWCYDPLTTEPPVNSLPALTNNGVITFGCLNTFCKITDPTLNLWSHVLRALPTSQMQILAPEGLARTHLLQKLQNQNIDPARITFLSRSPRPDYLRLYHHIDLCLDTFPYNGHTTSLDAYWMGVPVITLVGTTAVSRAGLSQLTNLGLPELIAHTPDQFTQIATSLAHNLPRLAELRATLRQRLQQSPLMNAPQFARDIESLYHTIWHRHSSKPLTPNP